MILPSRNSSVSILNGIFYTDGGPTTMRIGETWEQGVVLVELWREFYLVLLHFRSSLLCSNANLHPVSHGGKDWICPYWFTYILNEDSIPQNG